MWEQSELPESVYFRQLHPLKGNQKSRRRNKLPVDAEGPRIVMLSRSNCKLAVRAGTGSGKSVVIPRLLHENVLNSEWPVLVVEISNLAALKLRESYIHFGMRASDIHLKTGNYGDVPFKPRAHRITITTYGMLWKWLSVGPSIPRDPLLRYGAFFLDEFCDLDPLAEVAVQSLAILHRDGRLWERARFVAAGYGICPAYVNRLLGEHSFITIDGRHYTIERCVVMPRDEEMHLLDVAVALTVAVFEREDERYGLVMIFLPGLHEIRMVESALRKV